MQKPKASKKRELIDNANTGTFASSKKRLKLDKDCEQKKLNPQPRKSKNDSSDKKPKAKSQKFVAPAKLASEMSARQAVPVLGSPNTSTSAEELQDKPELDPPLRKNQSSETKPKWPKHQRDDSSFPVKKRKKTLPGMVATQDSVKDNLLAEVFDEEDSPLLNPQNRDQFVPSMEDDSDDLSAGVASSGDNNKTAKESLERSEVANCFAEGDSDSDCLDIEEDLPIPSLQQVLSVKGKGSSDQEGADSDPLEMAED